MDQKFEDDMVVVSVGQTPGDDSKLATAPVEPLSSPSMTPTTIMDQSFEDTVVIRQAPAAASIVATAPMKHFPNPFNPFPNEPKAPSPAKVEVLRIPLDGSEPTITDLSTFDFQKETAQDITTSRLETRLGALPDIRHVPGDRFDWKNRRLVEGTFAGPKEGYTEMLGRWCMYKCPDPGSGLAMNKSFENVEGVDVYGDAFVFRLEEAGFGGWVRPVYAAIGSAVVEGELSCILNSLAGK